METAQNHRIVEESRDLTEADLLNADTLETIDTPELKESNERDELMERYAEIPMAYQGKDGLHRVSGSYQAMQLCEPLQNPKLPMYLLEIYFEDAAALETVTRLEELHPKPDDEEATDTQDALDDAIEPDLVAVDNTKAEVQPAQKETEKMPVTTVTASDAPHVEKSSTAPLVEKSIQAASNTSDSISDEVSVSRSAEATTETIVLPIQLPEVPFEPYQPPVLVQEPTELFVEPIPELDTTTSVITDPIKELVAEPQPASPLIESVDLTELEPHIEPASLAAHTEIAPENTVEAHTDQLIRQFDDIEPISLEYQAEIPESPQLLPDTEQIAEVIHEHLTALVDEFEALEIQIVHEDDIAAAQSLTDQFFAGSFLQPIAETSETELMIEPQPANIVAMLRIIKVLEPQLTGYLEYHKDATELPPVLRKQLIQLISEMGVMNPELLLETYIERYGIAYLSSMLQDISNQHRRFIASLQEHQHAAQITKKRSNALIQFVMRLVTVTSLPKAA